MTEIPPPPLLSPDGKQYWDGNAWQAMPGQAPAMSDEDMQPDQREPGGSGKRTFVTIGTVVVALLVAVGVIILVRDLRPADLIGTWVLDGCSPPSTDVPSQVQFSDNGTFTLSAVGSASIAGTYSSIDAQHAKLTIQGAEGEGDAAVSRHTLTLTAPMSESGATESCRYRQAPSAVPSPRNGVSDQYKQCLSQATTAQEQQDCLDTLRTSQ